MQRSGHIFKDGLVVSALFGLRGKTDSSNEANTCFLFYPLCFSSLKKFDANHNRKVKLGVTWGYARTETKGIRAPLVF